MFTEDIIVENIKCGGCANSIRKGLEKVQVGVVVDVSIEEGKVHLESEQPISREDYTKVLHNMGYPEPGEGNILNTAKSYVSCMIGRLQDN